jgi:hypothetical protein
MTSPFTASLYFIFNFSQLVHFSVALPTDHSLVRGQTKPTGAAGARLLLCFLGMIGKKEVTTGTKLLSPDPFHD